ncbi:MAG: DNA-cytosine methyltransferase, partial [Caulobacteraceae bacterium]|nr:DNA-cytosine methyltransferase [Caulobacteraceae bacterium]
SAFYGFWRLMQALGREGRAPRLIVIENVVGLLNSNGGADFTALCEALDQEGYRFGALEIDAARFVPQSRPRIFMIASRGTVIEGPSPFHSRAVRAAQARLPAELAAKWVWWACPEPAARNTELASVIEEDAQVVWRSAADTERLVELMPQAARRRLCESSGRIVAAAFRRMRAHGQSAEVRFDGLAGCLRTPRGGSSRQILVVAQNGQIRSRLISPREGARLMGLADSYILPPTATGGLQVVGDGVAVPVVRHLAENLLTPLLIGEGAGLFGKAAAA